MKSDINYTQLQDIVNLINEQIRDAEEKFSLEFEAKQKRSDNNFEITHRDMMVEAISVGDSPIHLAEAYIIKHVRLDCGVYFGSVDDISNGANVSRSSVKRALADMQKRDLIRLHSDKVWVINPMLLRKGSDAKFNAMRRFYYAIESKYFDL